jgi:hypothetical protein
MNKKPRLSDSALRQKEDTIANTNYKQGYDEGYLDGYSVAIDDLKWLGDEACMIEESMCPEIIDEKILAWTRERERRWLLVLIKAVKYATGEVTYRRKDNDKL